MPVISTLPFPKIPHHSDLFLDYLERSPNALRFYTSPPTIESVESTAREIVTKLPLPRQEVATILKRQNESFGTANLGMKHIEQIKDPTCVAVVTGQQVGLFTGPLYTIYKALTAVRLSQELNHRGILAIPVFWMDSDDHDLAEVTRLWSFGISMDYRRLLFGDHHEEENARPVGSIQFTDSIRPALEEYLKGLADTHWKNEVRSRLESAYRPGLTFSEAFGRMMAQLFRNHGLVLFDSRDLDAKSLVADIFRKAIDDADTIYERLHERNQALERSGYHTQVHLLENSTVLFLDEAGERRSLTRNDGGFALKNFQTRFTREELLRAAETCPARFSPNVFLRPLVQDSLFPTVAYVGGPAEVSYFGQIHALYEEFGKPMPVIWPRASLTLIEQTVYEEMKRINLNFEDCFLGKHHMVEKVIAHRNHSRTSSVLQELDLYLRGALEELRPGLIAADSSLGSALETVKRKTQHQVESLQTKFVHRKARRNSAILEKADLLLSICYPNKNLQERELNVNDFLARYGPSLLDDIYLNIETDSFVHRLVRIA